jgi:hypothetical protein
VTVSDSLQDPKRSPAEKEIAARALRPVNTSSMDAETREQSPASPYQELTPDSQAMLQALGKKHLRDISEHDFARYAQHLDPRATELLCRQWREWICPEDYVLDLIGMSRAEYWRAIYEHAKSDDVRMNAVAEMPKSNVGVTL